MKVLLDTNAYSALMRGSVPASTVARRAERIYVSSIVAGELLYGFRNGARYSANRTQMESFLSNRFVEFLPVTFATSWSALEMFIQVACDAARLRARSGNAR